MLNVVALEGRLTRDPELRQTTTGKNVANFNIACDRGFKNADGKSQADFIDCIAWNKTAEFICRYFGKGDLIVVDGRLQTRKYQDKSGNNRTAVEVSVNNAHFARKKETAAPSSPDADFEPLPDDEDMPF